MKFDQTDPMHRIGFALAVAALVTFGVWGGWMSIGFLLGAIGWVTSKIGEGLLSASSTMSAVHVNVAWIALGGGAIVGTIIGFSLRVDRLWERFAKRKPAVEERPTVG
jgi:hypothetical protein